MICIIRGRILKHIYMKRDGRNLPLPTYLAKVRKSFEGLVCECVAWTTYNSATSLLNKDVAD